LPAESGSFAQELKQCLVEIVVSAQQER